MAYYLFVPGGKRKKEDWNAVCAILESNGQRADAITLSDPEHSTLTEHISEVCSSINNAGVQNVFLAGHSYASFVITGAANAIPDKIGKLIYIDSLVPETGKSLFDYFHSAGVDPAKFGVPEWPPFTERLVFDPAVIQRMPKTYIHCTHSQFSVMTPVAVSYVKEHAERDHWEYFDLDSDHYCMLNHPQELAEILLGGRDGANLSKIPFKATNRAQPK